MDICHQGAFSVKRNEQRDNAATPTQILKFHTAADCYGRSLNLMHPASEEYAKKA